MCPPHDCPPSLPVSVFISIPGRSLIFRLELTIWPRIDSQTTAVQLFVTGLLAQVSSIIFVYCDGPENKWKLPLDFHPPSEAPHVSPRHSNAKGL